MRLLSLELNGFRGFPKSQHFDLDADAIVLIGANGHGKTSLFDGILWALSGRVPRLSSDDSRFLSMYSETGQARAELQFKNSSTDERYTVTRSFDGKESRVALKASDQSYQGPVAEASLINLIWPDAAAALKPKEALAAVLTRSVYLQQDVIRHFVEAASEDERFEAVSELVGTGRVTELQNSLERAKKAWTTATNQRAEELGSGRERLSIIEAHLSDLTRRASETSPSITPEAWRDWWQSLSEVGVKAIQVERTSREAPAAIDKAINELSVMRRSKERHVENLNGLRTEIAALSARSIPALPDLVQSVSTLREQLDGLKKAVEHEQESLAIVRQKQAALEEKTEQLKALAVLALKNLGDHCPVCLQTYNRAVTEAHLITLATGAADTLADAEPQRLSGLLDALAAKEKELAAAEMALRSAELVVDEHGRAQETLNARLQELEIPWDQPNDALIQATDQASALVSRLSELQSIGESLSLGLTQTFAVAAVDELRREAEKLGRENDDGEKLVFARNRTGDLAQGVIEALREASLAVVEKRLREITPLLQSIYTRIDPHPAFRVVRFMSRIYNKKGLLSTVINDPVENKDCDLPSVVLSSSQINALAVSVFLALNLGIPKLPLSVAMLDDPLQSLDDINLLGLVDLLRRTKDRRQLLVSTHDSRFGTLLSRKLRPIDESGRTVEIRLEGWTRKGPAVTTREIKCDPVPLRLVAS
jgi:exonuclease SbcC